MLALSPNAVGESRIHTYPLYWDVVCTVAMY